MAKYPFYHPAKILGRGIAGKIVSATESDVYDLNSWPIPYIGPAVAANPDEAIAEEVLRDLPPGLGDQYVAIADDVAKATHVGYSLEDAKAIAAWNAMDRAGIKTSEFADTQKGGYLPPPEGYQNPLDQFDQKDFEEPVDRNVDPMQRDVRTWSESDVRQVMSHRTYRRPNSAAGKGRIEKVQAYYRWAYGDGPVQRDATGRQKDVSPKGPVSVRGYSRSQDGKNVSVKSHTRSRPD